MKLLSILTAVIFILLSIFFICKPKSIKQKIRGSWICIQSDAGYETKLFQLVFYRNNTFYWYFQGRAPRSSTRGDFSLTDSSQITLKFSDTKEESVFNIRKVTRKLLEVEYKGHIVVFRRIIALKTSGV